MSNELRRSILRNVNSDISFIVLRRVQILEPGNWESASFENFTDYIGELISRYENTYTRIKELGEISQNQGIKKSFEGVIFSAKNLNLALQEIKTKSKIHDALTISRLADELVLKLKLLKRTITPPYLFNAKPNKKFKVKVELILHLIHRTSLSELKTFTFLMIKHYERLQHLNFDDLAIELVNICDREGRLPDLLNLLSKERPDVPWQKPFYPS